jgi:signal transduction histidine kinase
VRQHLVAASATIALMLVVVLALADRLALHAAASMLAQELRQTDTQSIAGRGGGQGRGGQLMLDAAGTPMAGMGWMHGNGRGPGWRDATAGTAWPLAPTVLARGELQGYGMLPWVPQSVVWAARAVPSTGGGQAVLLVWNRTSAVRGAVYTTYLLVIGAILLTFLISLGFLAQAVRSVTRTLTAVTHAGRAMAQGQFAVTIPPQPTAELHELSTVVTGLATSLGQTMGDLQREHARLRQLEQAQRQFVADASHELRAPLSTMALTLDAWHDGLLAPDERPAAVTHLRTEVRRLGRMVTQLLDLSHIESGRQVLAREPLDLHEISVQVVAAMAASPRAPVTIDIPAGLPGVLGDRDAVYRILRNLLDNARRFTDTEGAICVWAKVEGDGVQLGVADTGRGIPEAVRLRVWDRFARAERERASEDGGSGLGLAIVKALAEAMGGTVGLTSAEATGTSVWVCLAKAENERQA